mmetsp:Transcript_36512/g.72724  ORF Transcript_36512/g.72724 Transcript_36512/m.72724 type:complete len:125 (-) Transcript_36512:195-569(-)
MPASSHLHLPVCTCACTWCMCVALSSYACTWPVSFFVSPSDPPVASKWRYEDTAIAGPRAAPKDSLEIFPKIASGPRAAPKMQPPQPQERRAGTHPTGRAHLNSPPPFWSAHEKAGHTKLIPGT